MSCNCENVTEIKYKAPYELVKGHETDSGYDVRLYSYVQPGIRINPGATQKLLTGVFVEVPSNYEIQVRPKSSLSSEGLLVHFGTIDSGYEGEIIVTATNLSDKDFDIAQGRKIAQLVFVEKERIRLEKVDELEKKSSRGDGGFGSTGRF